MRFQWAHLCSVCSHKTTKNGSRNVDGMMFAAQQSVLLGCLSIPESFVQIGQSRKKFYFIRKGSKKAGAPIFNGQKMALGTLMGRSLLHTKVFFWGACQSLKVSSKSNSPEKSFTSYGGGQKKSPRRLSQVGAWSQEDPELSEVGAWSQEDPGLR